MEKHRKKTLPLIEKSIRRKTWLAQDSEDVPIVAKINFATSIHIRSENDGEGSVIPAHFFSERTKRLRKQFYTLPWNHKLTLCHLEELLASYQTLFKSAGLHHIKQDWMTLMHVPTSQRYVLDWNVIHKYEEIKKIIEFSFLYDWFCFVWILLKQPVLAKILSLLVLWLQSIVVICR